MVCRLDSLNRARAFYSFMYTRRGDKGETDTGTGGRTGKDAALIEVEGTIDELNSFLGMALCHVEWEDMKDDLDQIQRKLFTLGEHIVTEGKRRKLTHEDTVWLEGRVDAYTREKGPMKLFVVPGGSEQSAMLHVARTVCRRLERKIVSAGREVKVDEDILSFINRLSSMLFVMALVSNRRLGHSERIWELKPGSGVE